MGDKAVSEQQYAACPRCRLFGRGENPNRATDALHACPFQADVHNDPTPVCVCCDDCAQECADDI